MTAPEARQQVALHCRLPVVTPTQPQCVAAGRSGPGPLAPPASAPGGAHGRHWGAAAHPSPPVRNRGWRRRPPPPTYTQQQACQFFLFLCSGGVMTTLQPLAQVQFRTVFALPAGRAAAFPAHCRICPLLSPHETAGATLPRDTPTHALHSRAAHPAGQQGGTPPPRRDPGPCAERGRERGPEGNTVSRPWWVLVTLALPTTAPAQHGHSCSPCSTHPHARGAPSAGRGTGGRLEEQAGRRNSAAAQQVQRTAQEPVEPIASSQSQPRSASPCPLPGRPATTVLPSWAQVPGYTKL